MYDLVVVFEQLVPEVVTDSGVGWDVETLQPGFVQDAERTLIGSCQCLPDIPYHL